MARSVFGESTQMASFLRLSSLDVMEKSKTYATSVVLGLLQLLPLWLIPSPLMFLFRWWFGWLVFFYITIPLYFLFHLSNFVILTLHSIGRRSEHARQFLRHTSALFDICRRIGGIFLTTKFSELLLIFLQSIFEAFSSWSAPKSSREKETLSYAELSELLSYEESEEILSSPSSQRKMKQSMHHFVPPNPFRATVRVRTTPTPTPSMSLGGATGGGGGGGGGLHDTLLCWSDTFDADVDNTSSLLADSPFLEADSPASFPPTPFSRARVMSHSTERVVSTMFAARDRLRLEAQSASRDEYSRRAAMEAQTSGQTAVYDQDQKSDGIALTCGNHCALKVGRAMVSSCRAMIPIRPSTLVYVEFSITTSGEQKPELCLGLATSECPLNVMVGSWKGTLGLHSDGQILIGSRWFKPLSTSSTTIGTGSNVGILIYLPGHANHLSPFSSTVSPACIGGNSSSSTESASSTGSPESSVPIPFTLTMNVNGKVIELTEQANEATSDIATLSTPIFPTISIMSQDTRVWCRFCEADIVYRKRRAIGAPPGVRVYCLDGSLLLNEDDV